MNHTSEIAVRLRQVRDRMAAAALRSGRTLDDVTLVAVTKAFPPCAIREAWQAGIRHFGENRVQEAAAKFPQLPDFGPAATWHLVGHLQTNKVRSALDLFQLIHSVDSGRLAEELDRRAQESGISIPILVEVNTSGEVTKFGIAPAELPALLERIAALPSLDVRGLMTVGPLVEKPEEARPAFRMLASLAAEARARLGSDEALPVLSMGMSDDYQVAIEEGATMIRIGRALFGSPSESPQH